MEIAQSFIAAATAPAMDTSSWVPASIVARSDLYTSLGSLSFCTASPKTFSPNFSGRFIAVFLLIDNSYVKEGVPSPRDCRGKSIQKL